MKFLVPLLFVIACFPSTPWAQAYPAKPVRLLITFPPGGPTDSSARLIANRLGEGLGQPVITENRAGGGGTIAAVAVARAEPDGYSLLLTPIATHFISYLARKAPSYDPIRDFTPICNATEGSTAAIAVSNSVPASSIRELIDMAKREPGKLTYSSAGIGTVFHLTGEIFKQAAGVDIVHVPYKGAAQALVDLSSGQISITFSVLGPMLPFVRSGKIRLLGVLDAKRFAGLPEVPAVSETLPGFQKLEGGLAFFGPPRMQRPIVQRLNAEIVKAVFAQDVRTKLEEGGASPIACTLEEFAVILKSSLDIFGRALRLAGVAPE